MFAFAKFHSYFLGTAVLVQMHHWVLRYFMEKSMNNHDTLDGCCCFKSEMNDMFINEKVLVASHDLVPWFVDFANYLASDLVLSYPLSHHDVKMFFLYESYLYLFCAYGIICHCAPEVEILSVLEACHSSPISRHHSSVWTTYKILQCKYYRPIINIDAHDIAKSHYYK